MSSLDSIVVMMRCGRCREKKGSYGWYRRLIGSIMRLLHAIVQRRPQNSAYTIESNIAWATFMDRDP